MKPGISVGAGLMGPYGLGCATVLMCLLLPLLFLSALRTDQPLSIANLQVWITGKDAGDEAGFTVDGGSVSNIISTSSSAEAAVKPGDGANEEVESKVECNFSEFRTNVCELHGDVRIHGPSSTVRLIAANPRRAARYPAGRSSSTASSTWKIRPYARKWEESTMSTVKELTLTINNGSSDNNNDSRPCSLNHSVPAIVFSTGGFQGNYFHELVDVLVPLFLTSNRYDGEVRFLIVDFKPWWVEKYGAIIKRLSRYEVINLDADDDQVRCFRNVVVGLHSHRELGIDSHRAPPGSSMLDFRSFLRRCFQLRRDFVFTPLKQGDVTVAGASGTRREPPPRLLIVSRKNSRVLLNEREVAMMAMSLGYKVVMAGPDLASNLTQMARIVNSCDVMMGVHGAGLSNMVFLPTNATIIQIIPWGGIKRECEFAFRYPAVNMGLRYLDYEIGIQESSLVNQYPENHPVLTDPGSIRKQGFQAIWSTFLNKQDVTLDLDRFKAVLLQALERSQP